MGGNEYGISGHLSIFTFFFKHLKHNDAFEVHFIRASFLHLIKDTDNM